MEREHPGGSIPGGTTRREVPFCLEVKCLTHTVASRGGQTLQEGPMFPQQRQVWEGSTLEVLGNIPLMAGT